MPALYYKNRLYMRGGSGDKEDVISLTSFPINIVTYENVEEEISEIETLINYNISYENYDLLNFAAIPLIGSNTQKGTASASTYFGNSYLPYMAFKLGYGNYWLPTAADTTPYIQYTWDSGLYKFSKMTITTYGKKITSTRNFTIEGLKSDDTWENCLNQGSIIVLEFPLNNAHIYSEIELNNNNYKAIKISTTEPLYSANTYECDLGSIQVFSEYSEE